MCGEGQAAGRNIWRRPGRRGTRLGEGRGGTKFMLPDLPTLASRITPSRNPLPFFYDARHTSGMTEQRMPIPPFNAESAAKKVQAAEDAWNTRNPEKVAQAYTVDTVWRNRDEHIEGREAVVEFLTRKWEREREYRLRKNLWSFTDDRIGVRFQYEWQDDNGQWWRSYGNELWQFDENGYMARREASINDRPIDVSELRITPGEGELPVW